MKLFKQWAADHAGKCEKLTFQGGFQFQGKKCEWFCKIMEDSGSSALAMALEKNTVLEWLG
jgi:hypothetical protein